MTEPTALDLHVCVACPDQADTEDDRDVLLPDHAGWLAHMAAAHGVTGLREASRCQPRRCGARTNRGFPTDNPYVLLDATAPVVTPFVRRATSATVAFPLRQLSLLEAV